MLFIGPYLRKYDQSTVNSQVLPVSSVAFQSAWNIPLTECHQWGQECGE